MEQLDLSEIVQDFKTKYYAKAEPPAWFENLFKDIVNKNITIETWNSLVNQVKNLSHDDVTFYKTILEVLGFLIDTNEVLKNFYSEYLLNVVSDINALNSHIYSNYDHASSINSKADIKIASHNTTVGRHAVDHANTLQGAKDHTIYYADGKISQELNKHNTDVDAHKEIQDDIVMYFNDAYNLLVNHKGSSTDHSDIRQSVVNAIATLTAALSTHNGSTTSHVNLLNRLSAVEAVASGKSNTWVFNDHMDMIDFLADVGEQRIFYPYDISKWSTGDKVLTIGDGLEYWYVVDDATGMSDEHGHNLLLMEDGYPLGYLENINSSDLVHVLDYALQASASAELAEGYADDALGHRNAAEGFKNTAVTASNAVKDAIKRYYFTDITTASVAINAGTVQAGDTTKLETHGVEVYMLNKIITLNLLSDVTISADVTFSKTLTFNTNGYNIELQNSARLRFAETDTTVAIEFNCKGSTISRSGTQTPNLVSLSVTCSDFTINDATIIDYNSTGGCSTIAISRANNVSNINRCNIKTSGYDLAYCVNGIKSKQINITDCTCLAGALVPNAAIYSAEQTYSVTVYTTLNVEELNISGGTFSSECMALSLHDSRTIIKETTFESCDHGVYFSSEKAYATGCTFKHLKWSSLQCATLVYPFKDGAIKVKSQYSPERVDYDNYGIFYVGASSSPVSVAIYNCTEVSDSGLAYINISSNYDMNDSHLYLSKYTAVKPIRVDGLNSMGHKGHLYIGKDVVYPGVTYGGSSTGLGHVDSTNYIDTYFSTIESIDNRKAVEKKLGVVETDITLLQKEVKDTSRMIAEANPNGEPRATVSGKNSISLPKAATMGGGKVTIDGNLLTNLVENGDFSNGIVGWGSSYGSLYAEENVCVYTVTSHHAAARIHRVDLKAVAGNVYYIRGYIKPKYSNKTFFNFGGISSKEWSPTAGVWNKYSAVLTTMSDDVFRVYHNSADNYAVGETVEFKNIFAIDLTAHGLDTLTVEQLDAMTDLYFSGTQAVTKTRVKSVGKNLFDPSSLEIPKSDNGITVQYLKAEDCLLINGTATSTSDVLRGFLNIPNIKGSYYSLSSKYLSGTVTRPNDTDYAVAYFGANDSVNSKLNWETVSLKNENTFRPNVRCSYDYITVFWVFTQEGVSYNNYKVKIQLEQNTVATPYEPHTSNTVYLAPHSLYSLPNGVKDTIDTNGDYVRRISKDTVSGIIPVNTTIYPLAKDGGQFVNYLTAGGIQIGVIGTGSAIGLGTLYYELALPVITPNQATGTLTIYPNGKVYLENAFADGGLYDDGITVLNTDFPIKTLERIQKITDGYAVDIYVSKAVVSLDKLSFTHPNLVNGDVIVFEYLYEYAGINGQAEVEYLDNRFVIADTANGKFYKYKPVVTNGVITSWVVVEV